MHIMIKHHCTEQQPYAIMVAHHMHYDNLPLYHTHILWEYLGLSLIHNEP